MVMHRAANKISLAVSFLAVRSLTPRQKCSLVFYKTQAEGYCLGTKTCHSIFIFFDVEYSEIISNVEKKYLQISLVRFTCSWLPVVSVVALTSSVSGE